MDPKIKSAVSHALRAAAAVLAGRLTKQTKRKIERAGKKHERKEKIWVDVTGQPEKERSRYIGHATFMWNGDFEKKKHSQMISLDSPAKLTVKAKRLFVKPRDGDGYFWGTQDDESETKPKQAEGGDEGEKPLAGLTHPSQIKRPKGWRDGEDEPDLTDENEHEWGQQHTAVTAGGSVLIGTPHIPGGPREDNVATRHFENVVLPAALDRARRALDDNKPVVFINEGGASWLDNPSELAEYPPEAGNEQWAVASHLERKFPGKIEYQSWDDDAVDVFNKESPVWERLSKAAGGPSKARAAMTIFLAGQGDKLKDLRAAGILDNEAANLIKKKLGVDMNKPITKDDRKKLYDTAFPGDIGQQHNEWSTIGEVFNAARQENLLAKIKAVEDAGGTAIALAGASHAWNLKPVLDKTKPVSKTGRTRGV